MTNNVGTSLFIGKGETRYAVFTVSPFGKDKKDPDMQKKLREEIPAFLYFLQNRTLYYPIKKGRMYFDFEVYKTDELDEAIDANISIVEREITTYIQDCFDTFPYINEIKFSPTDLASELKDNSRFIDQVAIVRCLKHDLRLKPSTKSERYQFYSLKAYTNVKAEETYFTQSKVGKAYCIARKDIDSGKVPI